MQITGCFSPLVFKNRPGTSCQLINWSSGDSSDAVESTSVRIWGASPSRREEGRSYGLSQMSLEGCIEGTPGLAPGDEAQQSLIPVLGDTRPDMVWES